jgi:eukaryotic-like serine/threonine-protein kinase
MEQVPDSNRLLDETVPPSKPTKTRKPGRVIVLICVIVLVIASSVIGLATYQNHVASVNATATGNAQNAQSTATTVSYQTTLATQNTATAVTGQATVNALATANPLIPANNPYPSYMPGHGTLVLLDTLSQPYHWFGGQPGDSTGCIFQDSAYYVLIDAGQNVTCNGPSVPDSFALEIHLKVIKGDCGAVQIRSFYLFEICSDGNYSISKASGEGSELASGSSSAITKGFGVDNILGIVANGPLMQIYLNRQEITSVNDDSSPSGPIGLGAAGLTNPTVVAFSDCRVWD